MKEEFHLTKMAPHALRLRAHPKVRHISLGSEEISSMVEFSEDAGVS